MRASDAHHAHHDNPGTENDPDFNVANPTSFWPWYFKFFTQYFGIRQVLILITFTLTYVPFSHPFSSSILELI